MARARIQSQKALSEARFQALYGNEEKFRALIVAWRWPQSVVCPKCGGVDHCIVGPRRLYQCNACRGQTTPMAGTIFNSTKLSLVTWFRVMYLITQTKQGICSIEPGRRLGTTQTTVWKIKTQARRGDAHPRQGAALGPHRDGRCLPRRRGGGDLLRLKKELHVK